MQSFPYTPRENQKKIVEVVRKALSGRQHVLIDSPTGSGKTVAVLVPCVEYAISHGKKVLYLTKTNTQQQQVFKELKKIREKTEFTALGLQGRVNLCMLFKEFESAVSEELAKLCRDRKKHTLKSLATAPASTEIFFVDEDSGKILEVSEGCPFFANLLTADNPEFSFSKRVNSVEEVYQHAREHNFCAYEWIKANLKDADVVVAPYAYFFMPHIQRALLTWWNARPEHLIVVIDEAHNMLDYCRELQSIGLSRFTVHAAINEAEEMGDPVVGKIVPATLFLGEIEKMLIECAEEFAKEEEGFVPPDYVETHILSRLKVDSNKLKAIILDLLQTGEIYSERKRLERKLPRSYMRAVANFMLSWFTITGEEYTKLVRGGDNPEILGFCLDPGVAALPLCSVHASIHMSGTLAPLAEYRDSMGLGKERCVLLSLPSPFPKENLLLLYDPTITTRYEEISTFPEILDHIGEKVVEICNSTERNMIVFFPSFALLDRFIASGIENRIEKDVYVENRELSSVEMGTMVERFRDCTRAKVMFAVAGGRLSEGMDFPDRQLEVVVIVGIPYPKPSARQKALQLYYDMKFRKGWEYTVHAPTARKMRQAIGRLIRNETDRGVGIILDRRAVHFSDFLEGLIKVEEHGEAIKKFFGD
ncbi:MAG: ATP-dependent DNA helicase [Thermoplasmata archaeon]|nr:ATP-dependent DNA helicase [Thermoplasmata archaeon]